MLFNSPEYGLFLLCVFIVYWLLLSKSYLAQNAFLLCASYFFYGSWDWRFLFLLMFSTALDYFTGIKIADAKVQTHRKIWLWISIAINLGFLGFFKYVNFFTGNLYELGLASDPILLQVILPVGISFYTFHGLSYVIDIYKRRIEPERNFVTYGLFVSFFPLLVAGPIERATHLLPQLKRERVFTYNSASDGMRQILWGLFKKIAVADNCARFANLIFDNPGQYNGSTLILGAVFFAFQIYGDFSGYSDIALGSARLLGIDLLRNFSYPYFSRDIAEFWRRWHISLSSWFRDYVYIPLGGSKSGKLLQFRNTFIIFLVSGFWHGANWTFLVWGFLHALYFCPLLVSNKNRNHLEIVAANRRLPTLKDLYNIFLTFSLVTFAWIFFRAESVTDAFAYINGIFSASVVKIPSFHGISHAFFTIILIGIMLMIEWIGRHHLHPLANITRLPQPLRWAFYIGIIFVTAMFMETNESPFIYFQF